MSSIVRVSILTIPEGRIDEAAEAMRQAEEELRGILTARFPDGTEAGLSTFNGLLQLCQDVEQLRFAKRIAHRLQRRPCGRDVIQGLWRLRFRCMDSI
jgi:hypothetical protein